MIKKILFLCFIAFQVQAVDIFQAIEVNDKLAIKQWLKSNLEVDLLNDKGQSLLHVAVQVENKPLVKKLLKKKIDVNIIDHHGKTAMDYAVELGMSKIALSLASYKACVTNQANLKDFWAIIQKRKKLARLIFFVPGIIPALFFAWSLSLLFSITEGFFLGCLLGIPIGLVGGFVGSYSLIFFQLPIFTIIRQSKEHLLLNVAIIR